MSSTGESSDPIGTPPCDPGHGASGDPYVSVPILRFIYTLGSILWVALCCYIAIKYQVGVLAAIAALIPLFFFAIAMFEAPLLEKEVEASLFLGNFLYFASIAALLVTHRKFRKVVIFTFLVAVILLAFSLVDLWVRTSLITYAKHIHSMMQTMGVTMLCLSLVILFTGIGSPELVESWTEEETSANPLLHPMNSAPVLPQYVPVPYPQPVYSHEPPLHSHIESSRHVPISHSHISSPIPFVYTANEPPAPSSFMREALRSGMSSPY